MTFGLLISLLFGVIPFVYGALKLLLAHASYLWPKAEGTVLNLINSPINKSKKIVPASYPYNVAYSFTVGDITYLSDRINFNITNNRLVIGTPTADNNNRFIENSKVSVSYLPYRPFISVITPGMNRGSKYVAIGSLLFGACILFLYILFKCLWHPITH